MMNYYDARLGISTYAGLFNPETLLPYCTYYAFVAFGELYNLGKQCEISGTDKSVYAVSATDGKNNAVMIANIGEDTEIELNLNSDYKVYLLDKEHFLTETDFSASSFTLKENQVALIKNY